MSSRKRSRWGDRNADATNSDISQRVPVPVVPSGEAAAAVSSCSAVSDQEALQALLSSAQSREEDKRKSNNSLGHHQRHHRDSHPSYKKPRKAPAEEEKDNYSYYGPAAAGHRYRLKREDDDEEEDAADDSPAVEKEKPNFGLSGALTKDEKGGGNVFKGVVLKFREPPEARAPNAFWRLYVYKGDEQIDVLHISKQSAYLFGRNQDICDISLQHPSCSSQHAVLQYRALPSKEGKLNCQPYLMDLESTNGSFINGVQIDPARYYQLKKGDVLNFGASKREYVLLTANTTSF